MFECFLCKDKFVQFDGFVFICINDVKYYIEILLYVVLEGGFVCVVEFVKVGQELFFGDFLVFCGQDVGGLLFFYVVFD